jgi:thioesterase domain-containing protein
MKSPSEIERFFYEKIPLTRAMGVHVLAYDHAGLTLGAPLALNHNHLGTAFGGSLNALATLCGYGLLWLELGEVEAHLVIAESSMTFRRPVTGDLCAVCERPAAAVMERFRKDFAERRKARIRLAVALHEGEETAAEFAGRFVALG